MTHLGFPLTIVIVNYRTAELVRDCMASLAVPGCLPTGTQVVVVDGGSGDNSASVISDAIRENGWQDRMSLVPLDVNAGFAYGNNRGIAYAHERFGVSKYVLLLNPDTVVREGGIQELVTFMDSHDRAGIAGSRLEDPDGTVQACAFRFPSIAGEFECEARLGPITRLLKRWTAIPQIDDQPVRMDWVSGASMIIRGEVLDQIGWLDEDYFLYYEEVDFCQRAARAGWECWHVPRSRIIHLVGQSTGLTVKGVRRKRRPAYWFASRRRYYLKHHGRFYLALADIGWVTGNLIWRCRQLISRRPNNDPPHLLRDLVRSSLSVR